MIILTIMAILMLTATLAAWVISYRDAIFFWAPSPASVLVVFACGSFLIARGLEWALF